MKSLYTILKTTLMKNPPRSMGRGPDRMPYDEAGQVFYADHAKPEGFWRRGLGKRFYQYVRPSPAQGKWTLLLVAIDPQAGRGDLWP